MYIGLNNFYHFFHVHHLEIGLEKIGFAHMWVSCYA